MNDSNKIGRKTTRNQNFEPREVIALSRENWYDLKVKEVEMEYTWTIDDFSSRQEKTGESVLSPNFSAVINDRVKWYLQVFPRGTDDRSDDHVSVYLHPFFDNESKVRAKFEISILDAGGNKHNISGPELRYFAQGKGWGWRSFIKRDTLLNGLLPDNKLLILCEITFSSQFECREGTESLRNEIPITLNDVRRVIQSEKREDRIEFQKLNNTLEAISDCLHAMTIRNEASNGRMRDQLDKLSENIIKTVPCCCQRNKRN